MPCKEDMAEIFPTITGKNLNKKRISVPDDFSEKNIFIIVAFQRWHQDAVDECIEYLEQNNINDTHHIIEVPVLKQFSRLRQMRLDGVMRAGILDYDIRERTITVYLDKQEFRNSLSIATEDAIHWFQVSHSNNSILSRGTGLITSEEINQIKSA